MDWLLLSLWLLLSSGAIGFFAVTNCCCGCTYFSDTFTADNLATDYTVVAGAWNVAGGKLTTVSSNALILVNTAALSTKHRVTANVMLAANGDTGRVIVGYTDTNNYIYLEVAQGAGSTFVATLYERVAGVSTQIGAETPALTSSDGEEIPVSVCVNGSVTTVILDDAGTDYSWRISTVNHLSGGTLVGFGTAAVVSSVSFDALFFFKDVADNPTCLTCGFTCNSYCDDGTYPETVEITLGNVQPTIPCPGGDCAAEFETTYILDQLQASYGLAGHRECTYGIDATATPCSVFVSVLATAQFITDGINISWQFCLAQSGISPFSVCGTDTVAGTDCTQPFAGTINSGTGSSSSSCDFDNATFSGVPVP